MLSSALYTKLTEDQRNALWVRSHETEMAVKAMLAAMDICASALQAPAIPTHESQGWAVEAAYRLGARSALEDAIKAIRGLPDVASKKDGQ